MVTHFARYVSPVIYLPRLKSPVTHLRRYTYLLLLMFLVTYLLLSISFVTYFLLLISLFTYFPFPVCVVSLLFLVFYYTSLSLHISCCLSLITYHLLLISNIYLVLTSSPLYVTPATYLSRYIPPVHYLSLRTSCYLSAFDPVPGGFIHPNICYSQPANLSSCL